MNPLVRDGVLQGVEDMCTLRRLVDALAKDQASCKARKKDWLQGFALLIMWPTRVAKTRDAHLKRILLEMPPAVRWLQ